MNRQLVHGDTSQFTMHERCLLATAASLWRICSPIRDTLRTFISELGRVTEEKSEDKVWQKNFGFEDVA